ncbi:MAG: amino acid ABC transporter permease [Spirochaetaceae bacterium]|jgi:L-cystine transport system permease protein|nr:amino acid ABC transporter permease [Spirochaetaceae bacterium]
MHLDYQFMLDTFLLSLGGIPVTLEISLAVLVVAVPAGFLIAIALANRVPVITQISRVYISFIRATPPILQIFIIYTSLPSLIALIAARFDGSFDIFAVNPVIYPIIVFSLSETAVLAEVFRAALNTVEGSQLEAALSVGMTRAQGYSRIVIPQALTAAVPVFCSSVTSLVKLTSLSFTMSVMEVTGIAKVQAGVGLAWLEAYLVMAMIYFVMIFTIEKLLKILEKHLRAHTAG